MANKIRRYIGQILLDGGFLKKTDLDQAFEEQKRTSELLGHVLVRMGVLKANDINASLLVQEHLTCVGDALRIAAGERQLLGALLVQSGHITGEQLDYALDEQKKSGEKIGDVFTRLGMLTERQLAALLEFQQNQNSKASSPLRLGELLVATGHISSGQLDDALCKQHLSNKKIGEVLVEEGYVDQSRVESGFRLQKMLVKSVLAAILSLSMSAPAFASGVTLQWNPNTESDVAGYKVYFSPESLPLEGMTPLDVSNQTSATIDGLDPNVSYKFAVTAYNDAGIESPFSNSVTITEQVPPTVDITSPADYAKVSGAVSMSVNAYDNVGITKVEFYVNGILVATETGAPYFYTWDTLSTAAGAYTLTAKAYDTAGNVSQSSKSVTVVNDNITPSVALTSPTNNFSIKGTVTISANASDNVGVTNVEFYCNGVLLYASNVAPFSFKWDSSTVDNGVYTIIAKAYDNAGNAKESLSATVLVSNPVPDLTAPTVNSFNMPVTYTSLSVPVYRFTAADNVKVAGYMITLSATAPAAGAAGWSATAPVNFTFPAAGKKTAYAWVKDAVGNVSASSSASVTITQTDSTAPVITAFTMPKVVKSTIVPVSRFTATDNKAVTGYMITESATPPSANSPLWLAKAPSSFKFTSSGVKTAYAWVKDANGNVSASLSASVKIIKYK